MEIKETHILFIHCQILQFKLFHAQVFADIGDYAMQLKTLESNEEDIIDKTIFHEMKASALSKLGKSDLAITEIE